MICPNCNTEQDEGIGHCLNCGLIFGRPCPICGKIGSACDCAGLSWNKKATIQTFECPSCGDALHEVSDQFVCPRCGRVPVLTVSSESFDWIKIPTHHISAAKFYEAILNLLEEAPFTERDKMKLAIRWFPLRKSARKFTGAQPDKTFVVHEKDPATSYLTNTSGLNFVNLGD